MREWWWVVFRCFGDGVCIGLPKWKQPSRKGYTMESADLVHMEQTLEARMWGWPFFGQQASSILWLLTWSCAAHEVSSVREHHSKSINMTSRSCQGCLPPLPSGDLCIHITLKGIHSCRVDGNLIGRYVPRQKEQVGQNVRPGEFRENLGQVRR